MNTENYFNKEKLVKLSIHLTKVSEDYYYHPGIKFLGITIQRQGVYDYIWNKLQDINQLPNHYTLAGIVYRNPFIVLHYEAGHSLKKNFENDNAARSFAHKVMKGGPFTISGL